MRSSNRTHSAPRDPDGGFILSLAILLIVTILIIGSLVGLAALRNGLLQRAGINLVKDSSNPLRFLGRPVDYGICEEPLVYCVDPGRGGDPDPAAHTLALVGVRADRFVTRNAVYYTGADCFDDPTNPTDVFVAPPAAPAPLGQLVPDLPVGYLDALESVGRATPLSYGVGAPAGFDIVTMLPVGPGRLYRSADEPAAAVAVASVWTSMAPDCSLTETGGGGGVAGDLVVYEFTGSSATPTTVAAGVTASNVSVTGAVGSGGADIGNGGGCSPSNADTAIICADDPGSGGAPNPNEVPAAFLELTISCTGGEPLDPASLSFNGAITGTARFGRAHVRISTDAFVGTDIEVPTSPMDMLSTTFSNFSYDLTSFAPAPQLWFRIHPEDNVDNTPGAGNGNRFGGLIDDLTFNGECVGAMGGGGAADICTNLSETFDLIRADEVVENPAVAGSPNVLSVFTPPFSIMPSMLESTPPGPEGAPLTTGPGIPGPGTPAAFPDPGSESAPPLPVDAPGEAPPGPAPTFPDPEGESPP